MGEVLVLDRPREIVSPENVPLAERMVPAEERVLLGVDYLLARRLPDGTYSESTLEAAHTNLLTATKEMAIPNAISTIYMDKVADGVYLAGDQTSVEVAQSGLKYHKAPSARERVFVEIEEARHNARSLRPENVRVFISPRMSKTDASSDIAKQEHLADDDALRITGLTVDLHGRTQQMYMQALLVRDVPLGAWTAMLHDPGNIFGKSVAATDATSALSVMKTFPQLELPAGALPDGVKDLVRAVIPYIQDPEARRSVEDQYEKFHADQNEIHAKATSIADRWLAFHVEMAESLHQRRATPYVQKFVQEFGNMWGEETCKLLYMHALQDGGLYMTRELAVKIEEARVKTLWIKAAVANHNETVVSQMEQPVVAQILAEEARIQAMVVQGFAMHQILAADQVSNTMVAEQEVKGGGGCPGSVNADLKTKRHSEASDRPDSAESPNGSDANKDAKKTGKDEVLKCVKCPLCKKDGVDAKIEHFAGKKRLTCSSCKKYKEYTS